MGMQRKKPLSKEWCCSMKTSYLSIPPPLQPRCLTMNLSSSPTPISSYHHEPAHCTQYTLDHRHQHMMKTNKTAVNTNHDHQHQKKHHNQGSSPVKSGSGTFRGWNPWSITTYRGWQVEKSSPRSFTTTSLQ